MSKLLFDGREQFFAPRGIRMELGSKRREIEEREKFRPRYLPFAPLFALPSAGHITRYRFFEENRKEEGTLFDHRSGRWPGFDDTFSLSLSLSLRNLRIAEFLYRAFSNRVVFLFGGAKVYSRATIFYHELRLALVARFPRERFEDFLAGLSKAIFI